MEMCDFQQTFNLAVHNGRRNAVHLCSNKKDVIFRAEIWCCWLGKSKQHLAS